MSLVPVYAVHSSITYVRRLLSTSMAREVDANLCSGRHLPPMTHDLDATAIKRAFGGKDNWHTRISHSNSRIDGDEHRIAILHVDDSKNSLNSFVAHMPRLTLASFIPQPSQSHLSSTTHLINPDRQIFRQVLCDIRTACSPRGQ